MPTNIIMPQMGESIFEGTITKWLKNEGDSIERDEALFEISTDKVDTEIPSPVAGILYKIICPVGDIFDFGLARLAGALDRWQSLPAATSFVYLGFLATIPDTLIARKFGASQAAGVRQEAQSLEARFAECASPQAVEPELMEFDRSLKAAGLNPGTSADLTVATLFAASLKALA